MSIGISELLAQVGDDKITLQNLSHDLLDVRMATDNAVVSFSTSPEIGNDLATAAAFGGGSKKTGLILWIGTDDLKAARRAIEARK